MRKFRFWVTMIVIITILAGCKNTNTGTDEISPTPTNTATIDNTVDNTNEDTSDNTNNEENTTAEPIETADTNKPLKISDYYPFTENQQYIYQGEGNEYAAYVSYVDYMTKNRIQIRTNNGGTERVEVIENKNGQLTILYSKSECYYRENFTNSKSINTTDNQEKEILLKEPLVKGTEWKIPNNKKRYISNVDVQITTPAGTFKTLEVTTESLNQDANEGKIVDYYAYKVGLVKTVYTADDMEITSTLEKIAEEEPFTQNIRIYYPNYNTSKIYAVDKQLSFKTNDVTRKKLEEALKDASNKKYEPLLSANTKINSLYLNTKNIVMVDFSKELVDEMNAGAGYESQILQCITNTLGIYYGVEKVNITLDGKPYESGHIIMKKGETFKVDLDNVVVQ